MTLGELKSSIGKYDVITYKTPDKHDIMSPLSMCIPADAKIVDMNVYDTECYCYSPNSNPRHKCNQYVVVISFEDKERALALKPARRKKHVICKV